MADTPESEVFAKREGSGAAQIYGAPANVLGELHNLEAGRERRRQVALQYATMQKNERDKKMMELIERDPEKTFEPFNQQVLGAVSQHRAKVTQYLDSGGNPNSAKFNEWNKNQWAQLDDMARRGNWIKEQVTGMRDLIAKDPYLDTKYYNDKINDLYMDAAGNGIPLEKVNVDAIRNITQDPGGFNIQKYNRDFLKDLENNVFNYHQNQVRNWGLDVTNTKVKIKGDLFTPDPTTKTGVKEDENGNPIVNITPDFLAAYSQNPNADRAITAAAEKQGLSKQEFVAQMIRPGGMFDKEVSENTKFFPQNFSYSGNGIANKDMPKATRRLQNISALANAFTDKEGYESDQPSEEAQRVLSYLKTNSKFNGANVIDAQLMKGDPDAADPRLNNDRIQFKVKHSSQGIAKTYSVDLSDPNEAAAELNAIFDTAKAEGGFHISHDLLRNLDDEKFAGKFLNTTRQKREEVYSEEKMAKEVEKWAGGNMKGLVDREVDGKKIVSAERTTSTVGFGGGKLKIKFSDGSTKTIDPNDTEGLKVLKDIYASKFGKKVKLAGDKGKDVLNDDFWSTKP